MAHCKFWLFCGCIAAATLVCCGCGGGPLPVLPANAAEPEPSDPPDNPVGEGGQSDTSENDERPGENGDAAHPFPRRLKAPPLEGAVAWINSAGPIELESLRGKFVLLDFWTYCCINCMHILPELKKLEAAYPNELVVIGVHSAKFENEEDSRNITEAVMRYEIEHPVINDANHAVWDRYAIASWPSLRIIDPEGNLVAGHSGEISFDDLDQFLKGVLPYYRDKGVLDPTPLHFELETSKVEPTPLRFPGKLLADEPGGRLFVADSNHNRIIVARLDGTLLDVIGSGQIGHLDGNWVEATLNHPQGMALHGDSLYVADTENHLLRKVDLKARTVATIAGTAEQARMGWPGLDPLDRDEDGQVKFPKRWVGKPLATAINSPWDLWVHGTDLFIAMAGPHQIWKMPLDESEIGPYAGNGREDIVDGPLLPRQPYDEGFASFAQPSGLTSDGTWLYVADSEGSSIRAVPFRRGNVKTVIGTSHLDAGRLFHFGDRDGKGSEVLLQHALGVAWYRDRLYVADTYNNKIKEVDPSKSTCRTLAGTGEPGRDDEPAAFDEPAGITAAAGKLYVADTNNHAIRIIDLDNDARVTTLAIAGLEAPRMKAAEPAPPMHRGDPIEVPAAVLRSSEGAVRLHVELALPDGFKINPRAPMRYRVDAKDSTGLLQADFLGKAVRVTPPASDFEISIPATREAGQETFEVGLTYYYCQEGAEGLCKMGSVAWAISLELDPEASDEALDLKLTVE